MKHIISALLIFLIASCNGEKANNETIISENSYLVGFWSGEGRFLDTDLDEQIGTVNVKIKINEDYSLSGTIGAAKLDDLRIENANHGFNIYGYLDSKIDPASDLDKKCMILLLVLPEEGRSETISSDANFHLKSNFTFDFGMRVGGVTLSKTNIP